MNKITPFLWFNDNADEAARFYLSVFPGGRVLSEVRATEAGPGPVGSLIVIDLELNGQKMTFLNGGPAHKLTEAFSFSVECETQAEIDAFWERFGDGGTELACGWIKDRFGLCWQIVPKGLGELIKKPAGMRAMMSMVKFDLAKLKAAAEE